MARHQRDRVSDDRLKQAYTCYIAHGKSIRAAAQSFGVSRRTLNGYLDRYQLLVGQQIEEGILLPDFPVEGVPIETVIERLNEAARLRMASYEAHTWFPVQVKGRKPIAIMWFGDPHLDDNGCNWPRLLKDIEICKQPGVYGANIGDTTNNWAGRLIKKYADQDTSLKTARELAGWFMLKAGVKWLVWILGNHDAWGDGSTILAEMAKRHGTQKLVMHDWEARFSLNFWNGQKINIWAAHDFPGDSMWNPLHGPVKAARFGPEVDLLACGHKHNYAISQWELGDKGTSPVMIRARGYKFNDEYARRIGKIEQAEGCSIMTVINPLATTRAGRVVPFADPEAGADFLQWLRSK